MIPKQLINYKFIKTNQTKVPIEKDWPRTANYTYENFKTKSNTYGVLCGYNGLIVIDVDTKYIQDKLIILEEFRSTFTVKTASKKLSHFYFKVTNYEGDQPQGFRIDNARGEHLLDFQGKGTQVIGPGSKIDNIGKYEIINNNEIKEIDYEYLKNIILNIDDDLKIAHKKDSKKSNFIFPDFDEVCAAIKTKLTIHDILPHLGITPHKDKSNCNCPLGHGSEGGKCFSYTNTVWNCFHCGESGNIFQLWEKSKNVKFPEARHQLAKLAGIEQSFKQEIKTMMYNPKKRPKALERMAKEFKKLYHVYTIRHDIKPEMYIYKNGIFISNGESYIYEYVRSIIEDLYQENYANKVIEKVRVDTFIDENKFFTNAPPNLIPFKNTVLNLETMKTMDYSPNMRFMNKHPVIYDPLIKPNKTLQFIHDITKGENDVKTIQELAGYIFWRENKYEKAIMLLGGGRNGKSKLIELLSECIGYENTVNIPLSTLEKNNFAMSEFHNKHANFSPDLSKEILEFTGDFKALVGRDFITGHRKFKNDIHFRNYAKFIFATNNLPYVEDHSDGFFDRWLILDFPYKFVDSPTKPHHKLKDPNIIEKISTQIELTGFVNWALEGLLRLFKNGNFTISDSTEHIKNKWLRESSSITGFYTEAINHTKLRTDFVTTADFDFAYSNYCVEHKVDQDNRRIKTERLKQLGISYGKRNNNRGYVGIKLKGKYEIEQDIEVENF